MKGGFVLLSFNLLCCTYYLNLEIDKKQKDEVEMQKEVELLIDQLVQLSQEKSKTKLDSKLNQLQNKIDYCESRINEIVYQLYELREDEIKIVEGK